MKAIYCDMCKKIFPEDITTHIKIIGLYNEDIEMDLCEKDLTKFREFVVV